MRKIYIIAGEASGDLHGANLVKAILASDPSVVLRGWGGDLMHEAGCEITKHYRDLAFMGFIEVIRNLATIRSNFALARKDILSFAPDTLVFIDYPGFNMRLLPWVKSQGIRTVYYIAPQVWAWHSSRVNILRKYVDELLLILPFEQPFFQKENVQAKYVGHPLMDVIPKFPPNLNFLEQNHLNIGKPIIALLPGSRRQEIKKMLPVMLEVAVKSTGFQWVIAMAPSLPRDYYEQFLPKGIDVAMVNGQTYDLLSHAHVALVTSGTATLETALFNVPQVVLYKGNPISYSIAKRLVKLKYISLVNLLLDKPLVKELIQKEMVVEKLRESFESLLTPEGRHAMQTGYAILRKLLGEQGASAKAAAIILNK